MKKKEKYIYYKYIKQIFLWQHPIQHLNQGRTWKQNNKNIIVQCTHKSTRQIITHKLVNLLRQLILQLALTQFHPPKHTKFVSIFKEIRKISNQHYTYKHDYKIQVYKMSSYHSDLSSLGPRPSLAFKNSNL